MTLSRRRFAGLSFLGLAALVLAPSVARADFLGDVSASFNGALEAGNYAVALPFIYLVGLLTALTPCVYPMILITVSVFGAKQAKSKREAALLSTSFVGGIVALFTPVGVIAGL